MLDDEDLANLYDKYAIDRFNLNDRGYIASVHPLELWTLNYLREPSATRRSTRFRKRAATCVCRRIRGSSRRVITRRRIAASNGWSKLRAYDAIGKSWQALGYPFATLTPSYAAAIGASGDRPAALAQLIGVIANDGNKVPTESLTATRLRERHAVRNALQRAAVAPQQQLSPEIAERGEWAVARRRAQAARLSASRKA